MPDASLPTPPPYQPTPGSYPPGSGPATATENMLRGTLISLIVIPVGVIVWVIIWSIGIVASIVAFGVSAAAVWLYQRGSGGAISRAGAFIVSGITLVTLLLSFYFGLVVDYVRGVAEVTSLAPLDVFQNPNFWTYFGEDFPTLLGDNGFNLFLALAFGVLGSFSTLRRAFRAAKHREQANTAPTLEDLYSGASAPQPYVAPAGVAPAGTAPSSSAPIDANSPTGTAHIEVPEPYSAPATEATDGDTPPSSPR